MHMSHSRKRKNYLPACTSVGRRAVSAHKRSWDAFLLPRSVLLRKATDDSHKQTAAQKKTKSLLALSAQMAPGNAQSGVAARRMLGTSSARLPAASDSKADGRTNTGDLRSSTSWFRGFHVRRIIGTWRGNVKWREEKRERREMEREEKGERNWGDNDGGKNGGENG